MNVYGAHQELWELWRGTRDDRDLNALVAAYQPLVRTVAAGVRRRNPTMQFDDLVSHGQIGLLDALERFDPERGVKFDIFAQRRIGGAIYEGVRKFDVSSRHTLRQVKAYQRAIDELRVQLGREPDDREVASKLGVQLATVHRLRIRELELDVVSISMYGPEGGAVDDASFQMAVDPAEHLEVSEFRDTVAAAFARVSGTERVVLGLYYVDGLRMADIGRLLGVAPSMVSKIHARAVVQVREAIEDIGSAWAT